MTSIVLVATGGTIASTADETGGSRAALTGPDVLERYAAGTVAEVSVVQAMNVNSYAMTPGDIDRVRHVVEEALADPGVTGVVVTHGTDTMEETALALDLAHDDERPVVLTGAQRDSDHPHADGTRNLRDALAVVADPQSRGRGVLVCFDGVILPARGVRKVQTVDLAAFDVDGVLPLGHVVDADVVFTAERAVRPRPLVAHLAGTRVDIVACYPGAERTAVDACVAAGAKGIVLEATGAGNAPAPMLDAVKEHGGDVVFVISTRVPHGPVVALYRGSGGGVDLQETGAVSAGSWRPGQARIALTALLAAGESRSRIAEHFKRL